MEGRGSMSNASPENFYLGYGPNDTSHLCNQAVDLDDSSLEKMQSIELNIDASLQNSQLTNGPSPMLEANSSVLPHNIDLNAAYEDDDMGDTREIGGSETDKNAIAGDSSNSNTIVISSGISGYVLEENEGEEDSASSGRRLSCKRRAPEDGAGQLSLGQSLGSAKRGDNSQQPAVISQENAPERTSMNNHPNAGYSGQLGARIMVGVGAAPVLYQASNADGSGLGTRAGTSSEMHQNSSMVRQAENSHRNIRLRRSESRSDSIPDNLSAWNTRNPHVQSPGQQPVFYQFNHFPSSNTAIEAGMVNLTSGMQPFIGTLNSSQTQQPIQWNGVTGARTSGPSTYNMNGGNTLHQDQNLMNDPRNGMLPPEFQRENFPHMPANLGFANGRNFPGNISSISQNGSGSHQPFAPTWFAQGNMIEHYPERMPDLVNRIVPQGQGFYSPFHMGASPAARERELPEGSANIRPSHMALRPGLAMTSDRQTAPREMSLRAFTAVHRRNRLANEVRNALQVAHMRGSLQFGDFMVVDHSASFDDSDDEELDEHENMRLDVDNMSYEQLLALEEQMGKVSTGLSEDSIVANLKSWKYRAVAEGSDNEYEPCCICQEEYADKDDLAKLKCGHDFHFNCLKKWLVEKNTCPICKKAALDV